MAWKFGIPSKKLFIRVQLGNKKATFTRYAHARSDCTLDELACVVAHVAIYRLGVDPHKLAAKIESLAKQDDENKAAYAIN